MKRVAGNPFAAPLMKYAKIIYEYDRLWIRFPRKLNTLLADIVFPGFRSSSFTKITHNIVLNGKPKIMKYAIFSKASTEFSAKA